MKDFVAEMGENNPLDRAIGVASKVIDSMASEWTDEKHRLYLNSIEASFVKQLYSREHGSNDLLSLLPRTQINTKLCRLDLKKLPIGQFKVKRRGCWEKLKFERTNSQAENESDELSGNHWIQHFTSHSTAKEPHLTSADMKDDDNLVGQSAHVINRTHEREATSSKQMLPCCSRKVHKVFIGSITEGSDQNFVDVEAEGGDELTRRCRKKRARNAVSQITDQVVPFVVLDSDKKTAFLNENNEVRSNKNLKRIRTSLRVELQPSPSDDQLANYPKMVGDPIWKGDAVGEKHKQQMLIGDWMCEDSFIEKKYGEAFNELGISLS